MSMLVLHETLLVPVLMYGSETIIWRTKRSRIRAVQMDNLIVLLAIRRMGVPNACIRELCEMIKWENERIDESVLWWFSQVEGIENDRIAKMVGICKRVCW